MGDDSEGYKMNIAGTLAAYKEAESYSKKNQINKTHMAKKTIYELLQSLQDSIEYSLVADENENHCNYSKELVNEIEDELDKIYNAIR